MAGSTATSQPKVALTALQVRSRRVAGSLVSQYSRSWNGGRRLDGGGW